METGEQDQRDMIVFFLRINDSYFFLKRKLAHSLFNRRWISEIAIPKVFTKLGRGSLHSYFLAQREMIVFV
jgi:hypothetical protein